MKNSWFLFLLIKKNNLYGCPNIYINFIVGFVT